MCSFSQKSPRLSTFQSNLISASLKTDHPGLIGTHKQRLSQQLRWFTDHCCRRADSDSLHGYPDDFRSLNRIHPLV